MGKNVFGTTLTLFDSCLLEANKLCTIYFSPEIDNLADQTIGSILFKVLVEYDLYEEGELEHERKIPKVHANGWCKRAAKFIRRWSEFIPDSEKTVYLESSLLRRY